MRIGEKEIYVNPPFGVVIHNGKKKGATAWARKCIEEHKKGKQVVMVYPIDKWVLMLLDAGAKVRNLKDVKWCAIEDGSEGPGTGRHIAMFILDTHKGTICDAAITNEALKVFGEEESILNIEKHKAFIAGATWMRALKT